MVRSSSCIGVFLVAICLPASAWGQLESLSSDLDRLRTTLEQAADLLQTQEKEVPHQFRDLTVGRMEEFKDALMA